jgi:flagellar motor switch protein FliM
MEISVQYSSREVNPQFASFVDGGDLVIICSFVVQLPNIDAASFDVIYPLQTLKPIAALLRSRVQSDKANDDQTWRERMERAVLEIPLSMTTRLSEPTVSMNRLIHLKKGDVFPINIGEGVEVLIENRPFYSGELGEVGGQAAISLTKRLV